MAVFSDPITKELRIKNSNQLSGSTLSPLEKCRKAREIITDFYSNKEYLNICSIKNLLKRKKYLEKHLDFIGNILMSIATSTILALSISFLSESIATGNVIETITWTITVYIVLAFLIYLAAMIFKLYHEADPYYTSSFEVDIINNKLEEMICGKPNLLERHVEGLKIQFIGDSADLQKVQSFIKSLKEESFVKHN